MGYDSLLQSDLAFHNWNRVLLVGENSTLLGVEWLLYLYRHCCPDIAISCRVFRCEISPWGLVRCYMPVVGHWWSCKGPSAVMVVSVVGFVGGTSPSCVVEIGFGFVWRWHRTILGLGVLVWLRWVLSFVFLWWFPWLWPCIHHRWWGMGFLWLHLGCLAWGHLGRIWWSLCCWWYSQLVILGLWSLICIGRHQGSTSCTC